MKKIFVALVFSFFIIAPYAFADTQSGFVPLAQIPGLTDPGTANSVVSSQSLATFFNNLYKYLVGLAAVLAVIEIIWGGLEISTKDSVSRQSDGKERIRMALFGLLLVLSPVLVFSIINPSILNLSLNLPAIDTKSASTIPSNNANGGGSQIPSTTDQATGCTITGKTYLKTAVCKPQNGSDAQAVASQWLSSNCDTSFWGLFGSNSSSVTCSSKNSSGCLQATVSCEGRSPSSYLLMDIGPTSWTNANLQPFDAQTASSLTQFISGCNADGGSVCTNMTTALFSGTTCPSYTTALGGGASGKCFNQSYYCFNSTDAGLANSVIQKITSLSNLLNSSNSYLCQPDLQFTLQPRT